MFKFIYPMSASVCRRAAARRKFDEMALRNDIFPCRTNLREETFDSDLIFRDVESGLQMTERRRVYTFTFYLEEVDAKRFLANLCTSTRKRARVLTRTSALLLLDDQLGVETDWFGPAERNENDTVI